MGKWLQQVISFITTNDRNLISWVKSKTKNRTNITLQYLTPQYDVEYHQDYVEIIEDALKPRGWRKKRTVRSIALSGGYGVGKSSILDEVKRRNKKHIVSISLAALGLPEETVLDENNRANSKTNRIQKEIVKQILYSENPSKMPGSQYRRVAKVPFWRTVRIALIIAAITTVTFYLMGWTSLLGHLVPMVNNDTLLSGGLFVAVTALACWILYESHNRLHIDKLSAGETALVLSKGVSTYFDEYLDEIVYFFETAKNRDVVILEDIDRFDDQGIFENLRSLNEILNGAKQLHGRRICFIYAVKDSIFEKLEEKSKDIVDAEIPRANRTKFFDLIIPVVPFISATSARNLMDEVMEDVDHSVSDRLIDLVASHIPDMRLIKNIRNEFAIFKKQVVMQKGLKLPDDGLFAMVTYKNTHLADFEAIRFGKSDLDDLYRYYRDIINSEKLRLNGVIAVNDKAIHDATTPTGQGSIYGAAFIEDTSRTLQRMQVHGVRSTTATYQYQGEAVDDNKMQSDEFWNEVTESHGAITVSYRSSYGTQSYEVPYDTLQSIVQNDLNAETWKKDERKRLELLNDEARKDIAFLDCADMSDLMSRPKFKHEDKSFEHIAEDTLKSKLAVELVRNGYIDRNFTLHTSVFHDSRVSPNAMNYIMRHVDPRVVDTAFQLSVVDSAAILNERPEIVSQIASYNTTFLDYLLSKVSEKDNAQHVINRLMVFGDNEREFMYAYLESGKKVEMFVKTLAAQWPDIFTMLTAEGSPLSEQDQNRLMNVALKHSQTNVDYVVNSTIKTFFESSYRNLPVFTSEKTTADQATILAELLNRSKAEIEDVKPLGNTLRQAVINVGSYKINRVNLLFVRENSQHDLSLDGIKNTDDIIYNRILDDVPAYLASTGTTTATITTNDQFASIIEDIRSVDTSSLSEVIRRAVPECKVQIITEVSTDIWPLLAEHGRFSATIDNVTAFIDQLGVDERLAQLLTKSGSIIVGGDEDEDKKANLAKDILAASTLLPSAELRASIAASLELKDYIVDGGIPNEPGKLVGWLLGKRVASDSRETFAHIDTNDIEGLAFAISKSKEFVNFMTTAEITPINVGSIVNHDIVPDTVKNAIVDRFAEFTVGSAPANLSLVAMYAIQVGRLLPVTEVYRLASEGVDPYIVTRLLQPLLSHLDLAQISPILVPLGGVYAELTERSGKRLRFEKNELHSSLISRMKQLGTVSTINEKGGQIQANMRRPA